MTFEGGFSLSEYFITGMSFDDMLQAYKEFGLRKPSLDKSNAPYAMHDDSSDDNSIRPKNERRPLGIRNLAIASRKNGKPPKLPDHRKGVSTKRKKEVGHGCFVTVDNIPPNIKEKEFRTYFSPLGRILKVCRNSACPLSKFQVHIFPDQNRALIHFVSKKEAMAVVDVMHSKDIGNYTLQLRLGRYMY